MKPKRCLHNVRNQLPLMTHREISTLLQCIKQDSIQGCKLVSRGQTTNFLQGIIACGIWYGSQAQPILNTYKIL